MQSCLICDDHAMMREALIGTVELGWPLAQIRHAATYPDAWRAMAEAPDLCITDLAMPGAAIIEGIKALRAAAPDTPVLVVTGNEDDAILTALFRLGIRGFVPKTSKGSVLTAAIQIVLAGEAYVPPRLLTLVGGDASGAMSPPVAPAITVRLTDRQREILHLMAEGRSNKEIARALAISPATVKAHLAAIMAALGATNRTEAAMLSHSLGLI